MTVDAQRREVHRHILKMPMRGSASGAFPLAAYNTFGPMLKAPGAEITMVRGTFFRQPMVMAASRAVLRHMKANGFITKAQMDEALAFDITRVLFERQQDLAAIHPEDRERVGATVRDALERGEPFEFEERIVRPGGEVRTLESKGYVYRDGGRPVRMIGICHDVTDARAARVARAADEERFRRIVETAHEGVWTIDVAGVTTYVNGRMAGMLGYAPDEMLTMRFQEMTHPDDLAADVEQYTRVLDGKIDGYTLEEALTAIGPRIKIPLYFDHAALAEYEIDPAKVQVRFPRSRTFYKRVIDRVLAQARLGSQLRVDEAGAPFLWITR